MYARLKPPVAVAALMAVSCGDTNVTESGASDIPLSAVTEDVYTVGSESGEDWEILNRIATVNFDVSGNLYILDEGAYRVVVIDQEGSLVRTVGRQGDGPGELAGPMTSAVLDDGRLVVFDMGLPGAFEVFGGDGSFLTSTTVDIRRGTPGQILLPLPGDRFVSTGGMKLRMAGQGEPDEPDKDDHLRDIDLFHLDGSEKEVLYRAWNLPPAEQVDEVTATNAEGRREFTMAVQRMRAFTPQLHLGTLSDGRVVVVDSVGYRMKLIAMDGTVDSTIGRPIDPELVTGAIQEAARKRWIESISTSAGPRIGGMDLGGAEVAEQFREQRLAQVENMIFLDEIPVIADMAVDREDRIWVARTAPGGAGAGPIDLMTPGGDYIGTLPPDGPRIPDAFGPGGLMAYVETDEMDVPTVRVVRLVSLER